MKVRIDVFKSVKSLCVSLDETAKRETCLSVSLSFILSKTWFGLRIK